MTKNNTQHSSIKSIRIRTTPPIKDPKELESIITASLRSLFGDYQPYSCDLRILKCQPCCRSFATESLLPKNRNNDTNDDDDDDTEHSYDAILECPSWSEKYVRAALTFSSIPPFLQGSVYRIDFLQSQRMESDRMDSHA